MTVNQKLNAMPLDQLVIKLALLSKVIKEAQADDDKRWCGLIDQQRQMNKVLVARKKQARLDAGLPEIEHIIIKMQPLRLTCRAVRP